MKLEKYVTVLPHIIFLLLVLDILHFLEMLMIIKKLSDACTDLLNKNRVYRQ